MKHKLKINGELIDIDVPEWCRYVTHDGGQRGRYFWSQDPNLTSEKEGYTQSIAGSYVQQVFFNYSGERFKLSIKDFLDKYEARHRLEKDIWVTDEEFKELKRVGSGKTIYEVAKEMQEKFKEEFGEDIKQEVILGRREDGIFGVTGTAPVDQEGNLLTPQQLGGFLPDEKPAPDQALKELEKKYEHLKKEWEELSENYKRMFCENQQLKETIVSMAIKLGKK